MLYTMCSVCSIDAAGAIEEHWQVYDPGTAGRLAKGVEDQYPDRKVKITQVSEKCVVYSAVVLPEELEALPQAKAVAVARDWVAKAKVAARLDR